MKPIAKRNFGGYPLDQAHQNSPTTTDEATSRWSGFAYKATVQKYLLDEQYGLCCYSELRADLEGLGYHIEHLQPKSQYPARTFDYSNLAVSALSDDDLKTFKGATFGGHAKLSHYNPNLFVSCHDPSCARYFAYLSNGRVIPSYDLNDFEKECANYTIELLNLNSPYLINRRQRWHNELDNLYQEHIDKDWSLEHWAEIDLLPTDQKLSPFFSITRQFFGAMAERVLQQNCMV